MGVAHLAYTLANQVYVLQGKELDISRSDVKCAEVAGAHTLPLSAMMANAHQMPVPQTWSPFPYLGPVLSAAYEHAPWCMQGCTEMWLQHEAKPWGSSVEVCCVQGWCMTWGMDHTAMCLIASWPARGGHGALSTGLLFTCSEINV